MFDRIGCIVLGLLALGMGQAEIYKPYKSGTPWAADTLYVGASLVYSGAGPILVTLEASESVTPGKLYLINPAKNDTVFLFHSKAAPGTTVDVGKSTAVPVDSPVVFMYVPQNHWQPLFTGPNLNGKRYRSAPSSDSMPDPNMRFGHRWSVIGRTAAGDLQAGFEDWIVPGSDMDFDDILFRIKGLDIAIQNRAVRARDLVR
jgi:hypothetical protein